MNQNIDVVSAVQKYPIGFGVKIGGKVYHYAQAGGILIPDVACYVKDPQCVSQAVLGAAASAGAKSIVLTVDNTDGPTYNGLLPKDYLKGGYVVVFPAGGNKAFFRGITGNTAIIANPGVALTTVTLDAPIPLNLTIADVAEAIQSPYRSVVFQTGTKIASGFCTPIGVPSVPTALDDYLWLQTWGPCWIATAADVGRDVNVRGVHIVANGSGEIPSVAGANTQYAGFVLANDKSTGQGAPFFMLMIDPLYDIAL